MGIVTVRKVARNREGVGVVTVRQVTRKREGVGVVIVRKVARRGVTEGQLILGIGNGETGCKETGWDRQTSE